jgi:hypothetical protein
MPAPPTKLVAAVATTVGKNPASWRRVERGYTPAERWIVTFEGGSSAFVKAGDDRLLPGAWEPIAHGLRREHAIYTRLTGDFLPGLLGWHDEGGVTALILEDLSKAHWPPPWTRRQVSAMVGALEALHRSPADDLPDVTKIMGDTGALTWGQVAEDPAPFLSLGLCSPEWLVAALPSLREAAAEATLAGDQLLHLDVRSDNICFDDGGPRLVDWNWACRGNGDIDIASWAPSLHAEGGPPPEELLPDAPQWAARTAGYFAACAGLPPIPALPLVRKVQLQQLKAALPWAVRALGLPPLQS